MIFCPQCSSILMPKQEKGGNILACSCGYKHKETSEIKLTETREEIKEVEVAEEEKNLNPLVEAECPKCAHTHAHNWEVQTRAADEPPTRFFRCEKCKHTWREYK
ncbi:transcription factor S [Candidatus Woesearchaeota archaeon CG10_big_fil_rev_8_21_14_0_10_30_7]|nr:MAG: transcription factor S [Candidatus Woesearchaeota archaeon CG10_big_fil_rev_8_21_14_0_10_30_7]